MGVTLRAWSESLSYERLAEQRVLDMLAEVGCGLLVQVREGQLTPALEHLLRACAGAGVEVGLWLLLAEEAGYWPSERNAAGVSECVQRALAWAQPVAWIALDLERPLWQARRLARSSGGRALLTRWRFARENLDPRRYAAACRRFGQVIEMVHQAKARVLCAAHDYLAEDMWLGRPALQDLNEAPVLGLGWDAISVMLYGSLMPVPPGDAARWMYDTARLLGPRVGASVGLTASGVLGNEPHYSRPEQLANDAAWLKAAGVTDFAIYSLEGILASSDPRAWFRAVVEAEPRVPPPSAWAWRERRRRRAIAVLVEAYRRVATGPRVGRAGAPP
ncbi:MAG: hypothetical protein ACYDAG_18850 [Chloroflexota bacterium]